MRDGRPRSLGAMAMTGVRRITVDLGLVQKPPPEEIATGASRLC
jgi:hypothetical protein